jgi:hypothetical protein
MDNFKCPIFRIAEKGFCLQEDCCYFCPGKGEDEYCNYSETIKEKIKAETKKGHEKTAADVGYLTRIDRSGFTHTLSGGLNMSDFTQEERDFFQSGSHKRLSGKASQMDKKYFETRPAETDYVRPVLLNEFPDINVNPYVHVIKLSGTFRYRIPIPVNDKRFLRTWGFYTFGVLEILDIVAKLNGIERKELNEIIKVTEKPGPGGDNCHI